MSEGRKTEVTEALRAEILEDARRKAKRTLERAEKKAAEAVERAQENANALRDKVMAEAKKRAEWVRLTTLASVESKVRRERLKGQEALVRRACTAALERLKKLERGPVEKVLAQLTMEAALQMDGEEFFVQANAEQQGILTEEFLGKLAKELERRYGKKVALHPGKAIESKTVSGGVVVISGDCRQIVDNTFEGRLERVMGSLREKLAGVLFNEGGRSDD